MEETVTDFYRAEDGLVFVVDIGKQTAKVISSPKFAGDTIPSRVNYKDKDYKVVTIGESAFKDNKSIKTIKFGQDSALNAIEKNAFDGCSIEGITFPASLTRIGDNAFAGCLNLKTVEFPSGSKLIAVGSNGFPPELAAKITFPNDVKINGIVENLF
ncbi:hypothetical protein M9Y10_000641 [Tritrichomonas musculus]|uniref:Leucine-rich repeat domain-containing protein n=1 Tax=Tritrichomonas musculus TaxID=1915356 RepID=A0ABR2L5S2_9EUKA